MSKQPTAEEICHAKLMATAAIVFERRPGEPGLVRRYVTARERLRARRLLRDHAPEEYARIAKPRGLAGLPADKKRQIAAQGGKAAHLQGKAHRFTPDEARVCGAAGGAKATKEHLQTIGSKGGKASAASRLGRPRGPMEIVLHFAANHHDLRPLIIRRMEVVPGQPCQDPIWNGVRLVRVPKVGERPQFKRRSGFDNRWQVFRVSFPVTRVERRRVADAAQAQGVQS